MKLPFALSLVLPFFSSTPPTVLTTTACRMQGRLSAPFTNLSLLLTATHPTSPIQFTTLSIFTGNGSSFLHPACFCRKLLPTMNCWPCLILHQPRNTPSPSGEIDSIGEPPPEVAQQMPMPTAIPSIRDGWNILFNHISTRLFPLKNVFHGSIPSSISSRHS